MRMRKPSIEPLKPVKLPPIAPSVPLHPALQDRSAKAKAAHAHLSRMVPGFRQLQPKDQFKAVQNHIRKG